MTDTMPRNRTKLEIVRDILQCAEDARNMGLRKCHIMYGANLSYKLLLKYLKIVLDADLLQKQNAHYFITQKGMEYVDSFKGIERESRLVHVHVNDLDAQKDRLEKMTEKVTW